MPYPITNETAQQDRHTASHNRWIDPVEHFDAINTGNTDTSVEVQAALDAAEGLTVQFGDGTFLLDDCLTLNVSNVTIRGNGPGTILKKADNSSDYSFLRIGSAHQSNIVIENLTFDGNKQNQSSITGYTVNFGDAGLNGVANVQIKNCRFENSTEYGLVFRRCTDVLVEGCFFQGDAAEDETSAITFSHSRRVTVRDNVFRYIPYCINGGTQARDTLITGNDIDMGWWFSKARYSGSGGTVTYSTTVTNPDTITDSGASFPDLGALARHVRIMPVMESGSGAGVSYTAYELTDTGATFSSNAVLRGHIIRTASEFAIVRTITSETVLTIEEWRDLTTYEVVDPPAAGTAYTVYGIYLGIILDNTATSIQVLYRLAALNGVQASPVNGTRYEVLSRMIYPIHMAFGSAGVTITNNLIQRSYGDMIEQQGDDYLIANNTLYGGSDTGIACVGSNGVVVGNTVDFIGAPGIGVYGADGADNVSVIGNRVTNSPWFVGQNASYMANITVFPGSDRVNVIGNQCESTIAANPLALYGFGFAGNDEAITDITIDGNTSTGHSLAEYKFYGGTSANEVYWGASNAGTRAVAGTFTWLSQPSPSELAAGTPEGIVTAPIGAFFRDSSGGTAYIKKSGTGSTGWQPLSERYRLADSSLLSDTFTRADSIVTIGGSWTEHSGTWGISSNKAYRVAGTSPVVYQDATVADHIVVADVTLGATNAQAGLLVRGIDLAGTGGWLAVFIWVAEISGVPVNRVAVYKNDIDEGYYGVGDGEATAGEWHDGFVLGDTYSLKAVMAGNTLNVLVQGTGDPDFVNILTYELTDEVTNGRRAETDFLSTGTLCGLTSIVAATNDDGTARWDNFAVTTPNTSLLATSATVSDADFADDPPIGTIIGSSNGGAFYLNLKTAAATWKRVAVT